MAKYFFKLFQSDTNISQSTISQLEQTYKSSVQFIRFYDICEKHPSYKKQYYCQNIDHQKYQFECIQCIKLHECRSKQVTKTNSLLEFYRDQYISIKSLINLFEKLYQVSKFQNLKKNIVNILFSQQQVINNIRKKFYSQINIFLSTYPQLINKKQAIKKKQLTHLLQSLNNFANKNILQKYIIKPFCKQIFTQYQQNFTINFLEAYQQISSALQSSLYQNEKFDNFNRRILYDIKRIAANEYQKDYSSEFFQNQFQLRKKPNLKVTNAQLGEKIYLYSQVMKQLELNIGKIIQLIIKQKSEKVMTRDKRIIQLQFIQQKNKQNKNLKQQNIRLHQHIILLKQTYEYSQSKLNQLNQIVTSQQLKIKQIQQSNINLTIFNSQNKKIIHQKNKEINQLQQKISAINVELNRTRNQKQQLRKDIIILNSEETAHKAKIEEKNNQIIELRSKIQEMTQEFQQLKDNTNNEIILQKIRIEQMIKELKQKFGEQQQIKCQQLKELRSSIEQQNIIIKSLNQNLEDKNNDIFKLNQQSYRKNQQIKFLRTQISILQNELANQKNIINAQHTQIQNKNQILNINQNQLQQYVKKFDILIQTNQQYQTVNHELKIRTHQLQNQLKNIENQKICYEQQMNYKLIQMSEKNNGLTSQITLLLDNAHKKQQISKQQYKLYEIATNNLQEMKKQKIILNDLILRLKKQITEKQQCLSNSNQILNLKVNQLQNIIASNNHIQSQLNILTQEKLQLNRQINQFEVYKQQLAQQYSLWTNLLDEKQVLTLLKMLKKRFYKINKIKLIFNASQHRFSNQKFHQICDQKQKLLVIVKSVNGKIFGGFAFLPFGNTSQINDKSFIFSITHQIDVNLKAKKQSTVLDLAYGPIFGAQSDIRIKGKIAKSNYHIYDNCYEKLANCPTSAKQLFCGQGEVEIIDYEVHQIVIQGEQ